MAWEFEDLSVNQPQQDNSPAQRWEFEDVNVPSQTVLDDDSGEVYAVPVSFDERDTRFAIETQTKGADKADFFGKIKAVSADVWNGTQNLGKGIEESIQSAERDCQPFGTSCRHLFTCSLSRTGKSRNAGRS